MDLNALQLKINNYITVVSSWVRNVGKLYFSGTPENVNVQMIDDNGNVVDTTLPNMAEFRKRVWDDVGGALGQFNRVFYVDASSGSDTNDGSSANPFKSIKKAIDSIPIGGVGFIYLEGGQTFEIESNIYIHNKYIQIYSSDINNKPTIIFTSYLASDGRNRLYRINTYGAVNLYFGYVKIQIQGKKDASASWLYAACIYPIGVTTMSIRLRACEIQLHQDSYNVFIGAFGSYPANILVEMDSATTIENIGYAFVRCYKSGTLGIYDEGDTTYTDKDGNSMSLGDVIAGVVYDTNGVPRNVNSNVVL